MCDTRVLTLVTLLLGSANSFSWDIVVGVTKELIFYNNGTLTHTENLPSTQNIVSVTYDPVHYRVLFVDQTYTNMKISSFDISTRKTQDLVKTISNEFYVRIVLDHVTNVLFWKDGPRIYTLSLNSTSSNEVVYGKLFVKLNHYCNDIAVDSCGGYIYWNTDFQIERARLDGSEREVLVDNYVKERRSLVIDQQTKKIYWTETTIVNGDKQLSLQSANFYGKNRTILYTERNASLASSLAISNDFIYWQQNNQMSIMQLLKNQSQNVPRKLSLKSGSSCWYCHHIAANYTIEEPTQIPSKPEFTVPICQFYCLHGNCSVSAEGQPKCSCKAGYSGERCDLNKCYQYCLNNGVCSLNKESEPVCRCTADYEGKRCGIPTFLVNCIQTVSKLKETLNTDVTPAILEHGLQSVCSTIEA